GVYGLVAGIVKLDDAGLHLAQKTSRAARALGRFLLAAAPWLMKALSVLGTAAMFLVGGGILAHGVPTLHHLAEAIAPAAGAGGLLPRLLIDAGVGIVAGGLVLAGVTAVKRLFRRPAA
ncbi:MAG: DUF808 domain-containing protein, partial [Thiobacillus sp.]|nr:DUF808 domain-containing protein [Thiobacillus sp.]